MFIAYICFSHKEVNKYKLPISVFHVFPSFNVGFYDFNAHVHNNFRSLLFFDTCLQFNSVERVFETIVKQMSIFQKTLKLILINDLKQSDLNFIKRLNIFIKDNLNSSCIDSIFVHFKMIFKPTTISIKHSVFLQQFIKVLKFNKQNLVSKLIDVS